MDSNLQQAIEHIKSGDKKRGGQLLAEILKKDPRHVNAWLWLSSCVDTDEQKLYCLKKVLEINPNHEIARAALSKLHQSEQPSEKEILGNDQQPAKSIIDPQTRQKLSSTQNANKNHSSQSKNLIVTMSVTIGLACVLLLISVLVVVPKIIPANNSPQPQQVSPQKQPTVKPLPTITPPPTPTPPPNMLPGPARRYVPITNEGMPANYQYPIIDEYRLDDGDYYQIKFQALDGANILYDEPSYFFSAFVGNTIGDAINKYQETSQEYQVDSNDWKYEWSKNTYSSSLFTESGQHLGYMGYFVESGRIFRVNNVVMLITVRIRNLNGITSSDVSRIQQDLDKFTTIVEQKLR